MQFLRNIFSAIKKKRLFICIYTSKNYNKCIAQILNTQLKKLAHSKHPYNHHLVRG